MPHVALHNPKKGPRTMVHEALAGRPIARGHRRVQGRLVLLPLLLLAAHARNLVQIHRDRVRLQPRFNARPAMQQVGGGGAMRGGSGSGGGGGGAQAASGWRRMAPITSLILRPTMQTYLEGRSKAWERAMKGVVQWPCRGVLPFHP